jgi:hypothetical protein
MITIETVDLRIETLDESTAVFAICIKLVDKLLDLVSLNGHSEINV